MARDGHCCSEVWPSFPCSHRLKISIEGQRHDMQICMYIANCKSELSFQFTIDEKTDITDKEAISKAFDTQRLFISPVMCATVPLNKQ